MKLSYYYKKLGYEIKLKKCNISYYPNKQKIFELVLNEKYDKIFVSCIFTNTFKFLKIIDIFNNSIKYGGTGFDLNIKLPIEIENSELDYSIYPENNISYGFITRGCIRKCDFCFVPKKEGMIHFVQHPQNIIKHKNVKFMDNNILAYNKHYEILQWLVDNKIKYCFNQGLDIRLINKDNSELLRLSKYIGEYIFAFDDINYMNIISNKLELLNWRKDYQLKFYVYVHPNMNISDTIIRIKYLRDNNCLPYIMRDISCWYSKNCDFYIDIASWCNQPGIFKKLTFSQFLNKRHTKKNRINNSLELYNSKL